MTNIHSSRAALTALREIGTIDRDLAASTKRIATGRRIATAEDGAALWAIARTMESDISMSATITEQLGLVGATLAAAAAGLDAADTALQDLRDQLVLARANGADRAAIQIEIDGLVDTLEAAASDAKVGDVEILEQSASASYQAVKSFVVGVTRNAGSTTVTDIDLDVRGVALVNGNADDGILDESRTVNATTSTVLAIDVSGYSDSAGDQQIMDDLIAIVDAAMADVTSAEATIGALVNQVDSHTAMVETLAIARETALTTLVGTDMEEEAAYKDALLVRHQLAIEALAISNSSLSTILRLFE